MLVRFLVHSKPSADVVDDLGSNLTFSSLKTVGIACGQGDRIAVINSELKMETKTHVPWVK